METVIPAGRTSYLPASKALMELQDELCNDNFGSQRSKEWFDK